MAVPHAPQLLPHEVDQLLATELLGPAATRVAPPPDAPGLHVCPACTLPFVVRGRVGEVLAADRVRVELLCTNCDWASAAVHGDAELAALDEHLDRTFGDVLWTLEVVWIANEEAAIERFAAALHAGAVLPEDF